MAPAEPSTARYIFGALFIILFLAIPFCSLRLLAILPPLRLPPRGRKRPSALFRPPRNGSEKREAQFPPADNAGNKEQQDEGLEESEEAEGEKTQYGTDKPTRLLVVLGSGGHTAEMLAMLRKLDALQFLGDWTWRTYVVSEGDAFSASRAKEFEDETLARAAAALGQEREREGQGQGQGHGGGGGDVDVEAARAALGDRARSYDIRLVPRARAIHQSILTTPLSALHCLYHCFSILLRPSPSPSSPSSPPLPQNSPFYPSLLLLNGPATAVIVLLASIILRFFDVHGAHSGGGMRSVYVESWARVKRLSLSGKMVCRVVDRFVVQWEGLVGAVEGMGGRAEWAGVLV